MKHLTLLSLSLADLGRETGLDRSNGSSGSAGVAGNKVETVLSLVKLGIWRSACLAGNIFHYGIVRWSLGGIHMGGWVGELHTDVSSKDVLNLLLLETTLDDQSLATIDGATRTQFGKQVRGDVLVSSLHTLTDFVQVGKDSLLVTFTETLWWRNLVASGSARCVVGVLLCQKSEES